MKKSNTKKLALAGVLCAVAVVGSMFSFPVFGSKCAPVQHMVNVLCAVLLGPWYGVGAAFVASLLRNLLGLGSLMAFPGSMCGAGRRRSMLSAGGSWRTGARACVPSTFSLVSRKAGFSSGQISRRLCSGWRTTG